MKYAVTIRWNNSIVLHGTMTATMLHSNLSHMVENFAGADRNVNRLRAEMPTLKELVQAEHGKRFATHYHDETGDFSYSAERILPAIE